MCSSDLTRDYISEEYGCKHNNRTHRQQILRAQFPDFLDQSELELCGRTGRNRVPCRLRDSGRDVVVQQTERRAHEAENHQCEGNLERDDVDLGP